MGKKVRNNFIIGFIGANRTGKTSTAEETAITWKKNNKGKVWAFDPQNYFSRSNKRIVDKYLSITSDNWAGDCLKLRNGLLIIDEIKLLMPYPQYTSKEVLMLLSNLGYWNNDIIYITHNPSIVPDIFCHYTTHFFIFMTFTREGGFKKKIPNSFLCSTASEKVNDYVAINGRGKHKEDKEYKGKGFPFAVVDNEKQNISYVNMK